MKKILSIALAVVMVLSIASVASAFEWGPGAATTNDNFGAKISVEKYALQTGTYSWNYVTDETITAANGADVYYVIKLEFTKDVSGTDGYVANVNYFGIDGQNFSGGVSGDKGDIFYYCGNQAKGSNGWVQASSRTNIDDVVIRARCFDTTEAQIDVSVSNERDLKQEFEVGGYEVKLNSAGDAIAFWKDGAFLAKFNRNSDGLVTSVDFRDSNGYKADPDDVMRLYAWLNNGSATEFQTALAAGDVYMTNSNLLTAFGFSYKVSDSVNWTATNHPIIVDPNVGIPKTGDNASVIGFAMIMVAVVAAAVAVRKVNA